MTKKIGRLHVITDVRIQDRFSHRQLAELAIAGGADTIQFRDKEIPTGKLIEIAADLKELCSGSNVPLIINDRADVAMAVDADGVHLGENDLPVSVARDLLGPDKIIGASTPSIEHAVEAWSSGADYVGFGHIYATGSKRKDTPPQGTERLAAFCRAASGPVVAIGGIEPGNAGPVLDAGTWGVAVIGSVCAADDPREAAASLRRLIDARSVDSLRREAE